MPFHDLGDIRLCADPIPDSFGIDHHAGTEVAMVQAAGLIGANKALEIESFGFTLEMGMKFFCTQIRATAPWVVLRTLVGADKDVSLKGRHQAVSLDGNGECIKLFHEE
jgi:hypothetical protein